MNSKSKNEKRVKDKAKKLISGGLKEIYKESIKLNCPGEKMNEIDICSEVN